MARCVMGKGSRNREAGSEIREEIKRKTEQSNAKKRAKLMFAAKIIVCAVLIAGIVLSVISIVNSLKNSGASLRAAIVAKTEHFEVTAAEAQYFLYKNYTKFTTENTEYLKELKLDKDISLKKQPCYYNTDLTWFDYFADSTREEIENYLALAEQYAQSGKELPSGTLACIDEDINEMKTNAENADMDLEKYLKRNFGTGIKEKDVRAALTLYYTAYQYYNEYYAQVVPTDEDLDLYVNLNHDNLYYASYMALPIDAVYNVATASADEIAAAVEKAKTDAKYIASSPDAETFTERAMSYFESVGKSDEEAKKLIEDSVYTNVTNTDNTELEAWVYLGARKAGDNATFDGTESTVAVLITEAPHLDTTPSKNFLHIEIRDTTHGSAAEAERIANEIFDGITADTSEEKFIEYSDKYNEDSTPYYKNIVNGGVTEPLNGWLWAKDSEPGYTEIVYYDGIRHILRYTGPGLEAWHKLADESVRLDKSNEHLKELIAGLKVEYDKSGYDKINI